MTKPPAIVRREHRGSSRKALLVAAVSALIAGGMPATVSADTAPTLASLSPDTVSASAEGLVLLVSGDGIGTSSLLQWRGVDHPITFLADVGSDGGTLGSLIPASELAISEAFLTVSVTVSTGGAVSNPRPVTIIGSGVSSASSAIVGFGGTATVATPRLTATYTRAAAGFGTLTAADYLVPSSPPIIPSPPPIFPVAYVDLQLLNAGPGDSLVGTFVPPNPILPPNPVLPPNPILPPSPIRLAYWTGSSWDAVLGSGGIAPVLSFDGATMTATSATVTFDLTSAPQIGALGGTVFAFVTAYAFEGFSAPIDTHSTNVARAGRTIPAKWLVYDLAGNPVEGLDPATVQLTSVRVDCGAVTGGSDPVEAYASGSSGLIEMGGGAYQWNWATEKSWAGTCRRLRLDLGDRNPDGTPIYRTADFEFTR
ncbi:MAG TPA: PxKF domain-containing protein [Candidatus Limnocylindrales bacterium]|nr:PxKF domain-containing protein [Candidatus Limnocylindrales bacterium]